MLSVSACELDSSPFQQDCAEQRLAVAVLLVYLYSLAEATVRYRAQLVTAQEINVNVALFWLAQPFCYNKERLSCKKCIIWLGLVVFSKGQPAASRGVP